MGLGAARPFPRLHGTRVAHLVLLRTHFQAARAMAMCLRKALEGAFVRPSPQGGLVPPTRSCVKPRPPL